MGTETFQSDLTLGVVFLLRRLISRPPVQGKHMCIKLLKRLRRRNSGKWLINIRKSISLPVSLCYLVLWVVVSDARIQVLPSVLWGPFVPNYEKALSTSPGSLGTIGLFRDLFDRTDYPQTVFGHVVDVRDVARAHVLALSAPPLPNKEHKRLISSHRNFTWEEIVNAIREKYVGEENVQKRLPGEEAAASAVKQFNVPLDDSLTRKAIRFGDYTPFDDTIVATFEAFSLWEKTFKI
jgi:hypothetical protein